MASFSGTFGGKGNKKRDMNDSFDADSRVSDFERDTKPQARTGGK